MTATDMDRRDKAGRGDKTNRQVKILAFIDHYLPGSRFGGPVQTLSNAIERLGDRYEFFVSTSDRDFGGKEPYQNIPLQQWTPMGRAKVFYAQSRWKNIVKRIVEIKPDVIYLNSFFSRVTMRVLLGYKFGMLPPITTLLAPRGEFAESALALKSARKAMYIRLVNAMGLLQDVTLQASSEFEKEQIQKHLSWARRHPPQVAPNVSDPAKFKYLEISKQPGTLKVVFLSRISRNKNLDGALRMLEGLNGRLEFSICGPVGDPEYYSQCEDLMWRLPQNVTVRHLGDVPHSRVPDVLAEHHLMFLPSLGENFGHAIAEAFAAGRPVLISDRTPWRGLAAREVGAEFPLEEPERFREYLQTFIDMDQTEFARRSRLAREYAIEVAEDPRQLQQTIDLIDRLTGRGQ